MSKTITTRISEPVSAFRNKSTRGKVAIVAAGFGASALLGTGVAMAAESGSHSDAFASATASELAHSTRAQADHQSKDAQAKKAAHERAHEKRKADRDAIRKAKGWTSPINADYQLTADFGNSGDRWSHGHSGQDFGVPVGTAVHAANKGTVVKAGGNGAGDGPAYGNAVVIKHDNGRYTQYAHMSQVNVNVGEKVKSDEIIGKSGNTGNSSGPHLHFEIRTTPDYGSAIEPVSILSKHGVKL
ncbi:M23 family metallopeptidase [Streptomyces sp. HNM0574]|uniref:M23 family metallopeptidase n=1 Tax=Streptomyces sp. HNM0574 TaxID=2714954 RepID=UPI00146A2FB8|nr:M23 family metallopeptidase [Streptomyces sp. HNM0574]NLU68099.1 M23 family metallopeptidase [Streptomyces sp. HNM0574]